MLWDYMMGKLLLPGFAFFSQWKSGSGFYVLHHKGNKIYLEIYHSVVGIVYQSLHCRMLYSVGPGLYIRESHDGPNPYES